MAIIVSIETNYGFTQDGAYVKVNTFNGNKDKLDFDVLIYVSQAARESGKAFIEQKFYTLPYTNGTGISTLYDYLKTLPEYINPVDA
jgi:hypothetical protein